MPSIIQSNDGIFNGIRFKVVWGDMMEGLLYVVSFLMMMILNSKRSGQVVSCF